MQGPAKTIAIVGGGLAGGTAALTLRTAGYEGRIVLVSEEEPPPYSRPPLSKGLVRGEIAPERTHLRPRKIWDDREIELRLETAATVLDLAAHRLLLADGEALRYDKLLLATGGTPRALPGTERLEGLYTLRTLDDALALRELLAERKPLAVIGAGFIGAELAASAITIGAPVTIFEALPLPLARALPPQLGEVYARLHRERGVDLRTGAGIAEVSSNGAGVRLSDTTGATVEVDAVVVAVGLVPATSLAREAGLAVSDGIVVDELCRTSDPDVYAAGDVANHPNPILGRRLRIEHWQSAQHQAQTAARNMVGAAERFAEVPWVWSDQYGVKLQIVGLPEPGDEIVWRGDPESLRFTAFLLRVGRLAAAVGVGESADVRAARRLIADGITPSRSQLADPDHELLRPRAEMAEA